MDDKCNIYTLLKNLTRVLSVFQSEEVHLVRPGVLTYEFSILIPTCDVLNKSFDVTLGGGRIRLSECLQLTNAEFQIFFQIIVSFLFLIF